ncbi:MAG TPA: hypothetical protein VGC79_11390 [Polyangiaceae bacterium]
MVICARTTFDLDGDWQGAVPLLEQAVTASERGGDANYRLTASARLAFALCRLGRVDEALALAMATADEYERRWLRHNACCADGVFLATAGIAGLSGISLPAGLVRRVERTLRRRRRFARTLKLTEPLFLAGAGAWLKSQGATGRGQVCIDRALAMARARDLEGELHDVHVLAALAESVGGQAGADATKHEREAQRLEQSFARTD